MLTSKLSFGCTQTVAEANREDEDDMSGDTHVGEPNQKEVTCFAAVIFYCVQTTLASYNDVAHKTTVLFLVWLNPNTPVRLPMSKRMSTKVKTCDDIALSLVQSVSKVKYLRTRAYMDTKQAILMIVVRLRVHTTK